MVVIEDDGTKLCGMRLKDGPEHAESLTGQMEDHEKPHSAGEQQ